MKRSEKKQFDRIVERYLPPATDKEVEAARGRFLVMLRERHELQQPIDNFETRDPDAAAKFVALGSFDQLTLVAAHLLGGEGSALGISEKLHELLNDKPFDIGAVFVSLDRLERGRLVISRTIHESDPKKLQVVFGLTPAGERMLREVRKGFQTVVEALKDFA